MTLELILWSDHSTIDHWTELRDLNMDAEKVLTVGLVVKETDEVVAVVSTRGVGNDDVTAGIEIVKANILRRQTLADDTQVANWLNG